MYPNSNNMPTGPQHHPSQMSGPVPSPQQTVLQQGQQISRTGQIQMAQTFYQRNTVPRSMGMSRNPGINAAVVNQSGQQASQFNPVQVIQNAFPHHMQQVMINQIPTAHIYQPQRYPVTPQYVINPHGPSSMGWNYFPPAGPQNSNGYYPTHGAISPYPIQQQPMPQQQIPVQRQKRATKAIEILDPNTGKSIFDSHDSSNTLPTPEKDNENADPNICAQFATQVAATMKDNRVEHPSKPSLLEEARMEDSPDMMCQEEESYIVKDVKRSDYSSRDLADLADPDNICDINNVPFQDSVPTPVYRRDNVSSSINEYPYDSSNVVLLSANEMSPETKAFEPTSVQLPQPSTDVTVPQTNNVQDSEFPLKVLCLQMDNLSSSDTKEIPSQEIEPCVHDPLDSTEVAHEDVQDEVKIPDVTNDSVESILLNAGSKILDKAANDARKNKARKKKDYNKRGEGREGGEMDAFLDSKEGDSISPAPSTPSPIAGGENLIVPITIVDHDILSTIPLPGETVDNLPQNDISPSDPLSVLPSVDTFEKESIDDVTFKIPLKYNYKEDQWSPLNPEGKKQYDRDFLLQLQAQPISLCRPTNLPNLDVIKDKAHIQRLTEFSRVIPPIMPQIRPYNDFMPNYARGGGPRLPHPAIPRRSQGRGGEKPKKVINFSSSLNQQIKLHESENAWKPNYKADTLEAPPEELDKDKLKRSVQGVLNKLTPQKFDALLNQLKNLNIDTEEKLALVIDLIFEKAIDEPNFSVSYANMCKHLAMTKVPLAGHSGQFVNFRKLLLTKCQKEFEQDRRDELKREERMKAIETADPAKKKEMQLEFDQEEKKMRYRQLGNIRFIGELFKLNMLIEPIMHECIKKLLLQGDEESLECLCRLLKTIGKELDEGKAPKSNRDMELYFNQMQKTVDKRLTSSRVRFMLQDIIDLKKCNWVPRRDENNPKTIDQIHQEVEREAREQQQVLQNMPTANYPKRIPDDRDRRKAGRMGQTEDGWTSTTSKNKGSYSVVDPTKLKLTKPDEVDSMRLGPGGRGPQSWGRGSSGGNKSTSEIDKTAVMNRYSALAEMPVSSNYDGRRGSQRSAASSRESSRGRTNQLPPPVRKTPSISERENVIETVKGLARMNEPKAQEPKKSADVQLNGKAAGSEEPALRGPEYSVEDMEKKTKPLIDEFLHNGDFEEAIKCVTELASPNTVFIFITSSINQVLERSSQARYSLGQLLYSLLKKKIVAFDQYKKGFGGVLEMISEYAVDIPMIWDYMGELFEPMVEDNEFPLGCLKDVLQPCIPSETAGKLVSAMLHCAAKRKGTIKLGEVWKESGLQWTDFLGEDANVNEFIQKEKLEFTVGPAKEKPSTQMPLDQIKENLLILLKKTEETEDILDWIDANVSDYTDPNFIRALVRAVHEHAIVPDASGRWSLDTDVLKKRVFLLHRYIDHNGKLELQALYAIQHLMNDLGQPGGLLPQIFDILYDDEVINEEAFKEWEQSDDPNEVEGKGVAVNSVKSFFTWLHEPEE